MLFQFHLINIERLSGYSTRLRERILLEDLLSKVYIQQKSTVSKNVSGWENRAGGYVLTGMFSEKDLPILFILEIYNIKSHSLSSRQLTFILGLMLRPIMS